MDRPVPDWSQVDMTVRYREEVVDGERRIVLEGMSPAKRSAPVERLKPLDQSQADIITIHVEGDFTYRVIAFDVVFVGPGIAFVKPWRRPALDYPLRYESGGPGTSGVLLFSDFLYKIMHPEPWDGLPPGCAECSVLFDGIVSSHGWFAVAIEDACEVSVVRRLREWFEWKCLTHSFGNPPVVPLGIDQSALRDMAEMAGTEHIVVFREGEHG